MKSSVHLAHSAAQAVLSALLAFTQAQVLAADGVQPLKSQKVEYAQPHIHQFIVKFRPEAVAQTAGVGGADRVMMLSQAAGVQLKSMRPMTQSVSVMTLAAPLPLAQAQAVAEKIAANPAVAYAEPDLPVRAFQVPTDSSFAGRQWHLQSAGTTFSSISFGGGANKNFANAGGASFQGAWLTTRGQSTVRVAVLDTGAAFTHADLTAAWEPGSGYDFVSSNVGGLPANFVANDGDGWDADPTDPGDWITAQDKADYPAQCDDGVAGATDSSWHGTFIAGVMGAHWGEAGVGTTTAGAAPDVRIVPVRVLGKCGGTISDVVAAMRWAAGIAVVGAPSNPHPAHVINLSLGSQVACSSVYQDAVNEVLALNVAIVAATGNSAGAVSAPANCSGVIGVTAHVINGDNASYANVGAQTAISAPGGGAPTWLPEPNLTDSDSAGFVWSTVLFGPTTPISQFVGAGCSGGCSGSAISGFTGTSAAAPHVSAALALMYSVRAGAPLAEVTAYLKSSARSHPIGGYCLIDLNACGAGLLDTARAVEMFGATAPTADAGPDIRVTPGTVVNLDGSGSRAWGGKTLAGYQWSVQSTTASAGTLSGASSVNATYTAPAAGVSVLRLTVTDSGSVASYDTKTVRVNSSAPTLAAVSQLGNTGVLLTFNIVGSDADSEPLTYSVVGSNPLPADATLSALGTFRWENPTEGTHSFSVVASDGLLNSAPATVTISIITPDTGGGALSLWVLAVLAFMVGAAQRVRSAGLKREPSA